MERPVQLAESQHPLGGMLEDIVLRLVLMRVRLLEFGERSRSVFSIFVALFSIDPQLIRIPTLRLPRTTDIPESSV